VSHKVLVANGTLVKTALERHPAHALEHNRSYKISQRHLLALDRSAFAFCRRDSEQGNCARIRRRAGLDQQDWTQRFLTACDAAGDTVDEDRSWTAFASNVGKARILRREAVENAHALGGAVL